MSATAVRVIIHMRDLRPATTSPPYAEANVPYTSHTFGVHAHMCMCVCMCEGMYGGRKGVNASLNVALGWHPASPSNLVFGAGIAGVCDHTGLLLLS